MGMDVKVAPLSVEMATPLTSLPAWLMVPTTA